MLDSSAKVDLMLKQLSDEKKIQILEPDGNLKSFGSFAYEISLKGRIHEIIEEQGEESFRSEFGLSL